MGEVQRVYCMLWIISVMISSDVPAAGEHAISFIYHLTNLHVIARTSVVT